MFGPIPHLLTFRRRLHPGGGAFRSALCSPDTALFRLIVGRFGTRSLWTFPRRTPFPGYPRSTMSLCDKRCTSGGCKVPPWHRLATDGRPVAGAPLSRGGVCTHYASASTLSDLARNGVAYHP